MRTPILAIAVSALLTAGTAQAMPIWQFDKTADQDQADYITALVNGAQKVLINQRQGELAAKTYCCSQRFVPETRFLSR
jgi:hypothetical protein